MSSRTRLARAATALALSTLAAACPAVRTPMLTSPDAVPATGSVEAPLKVHLMSGDLLVLGSWRAMGADSGIAGAGTRYDARRRMTGHFNGSVPRDSIALLEITRTSQAAPFGSLILGAYTVLAGVVTVSCLADPKSCFGSCPTFYLDDDERPVAEGFSGSVARALEATDVDYLGEVRRTGRQFHITMRNEALETHVVRAVRLLVAERSAAGRLVLATDGSYRRVRDESAPEECRAASGACRETVARRDAIEWFTRADSTDLAAPDSIDLRFDTIPPGAGLTITARQSLMSTWIFYQALAWAGSRAAELLAEVERRGIAAFPAAWEMMSHLGTIEVLAARGGAILQPVGRFGEPGPIASDRQVVVLPELPGTGPLHVRLRFARGAWRFDEIALAPTSLAPSPRAVHPSRVERDGRSDTVALQRLLDPTRYLVTEPADEYRLVFELPADASELEYLLETRGYYYEWMRPEWLREEDPRMLAVLAGSPRAALQLMAPGYARREPHLEQLFWASRFTRRQR